MYLLSALVLIGLEAAEMIIHPSLCVVASVVGADGNGGGPAVIIDFNELGWFVDGKFLTLRVIFLVEGDLHVRLHLFLNRALLMQVQADSHYRIITFLVVVVRFCCLHWLILQILQLSSFLFLYLEFILHLRLRKMLVGLNKIVAKVELSFTLRLVFLRLFFQVIDLTCIICLRNNFDQLLRRFYFAIFGGIGDIGSEFDDAFRKISVISWLAVFFLAFHLHGLHILVLKLVKLIINIVQLTHYILSLTPLQLTLQQFLRKLFQGRDVVLSLKLLFLFVVGLEVVTVALDEEFVKGGLFGSRHDGEVVADEVHLALVGGFGGQFSLILLVALQLYIQDVANDVFFFRGEIVPVGVEDDHVTGSADFGQFNHVSTLQQGVSQSHPLVHGQFEQLPPLQSQLPLCLALHLCLQFTLPLVFALAVLLNQLFADKDAQFDGGEGVEAQIAETPTLELLTTDFIHQVTHVLLVQEALHPLQYIYSFDYQNSPLPQFLGEIVEVPGQEGQSVHHHYIPQFLQVS